MRQSLQPSRHAGDYRFSHQLRTRFAETDAMGIIHHGAYLPYLEEARVAYLRHLGHPYDEVRAGAVSGATFQLAYLLTVGGEERATAVTVHGCVDGDGKATRLPAWVGQVLQSAP
jgi:acyl-CoA thioester hydrolase